MAGEPGSVAVAIEVPHGPVVDALLDHGFAVHAIDPKQLDRLRDRFSVAGAKVGRSTLATLLTEAGGPIARRNYTALRMLTGVAPVTKRSGKTCIVVMRYAAQARLRQAVFHWARIAVQHEPKSRGRYEALGARGYSYGRALRGVADQLLGVACFLLKRRTLFDPAHGTAAEL